MPIIARESFYGPKPRPASFRIKQQDWLKRINYSRGEKVQVKFDIVKKKSRFGLWRKTLLVADEKQFGLIIAKIDGYGSVLPPIQVVPLDQITVLNGPAKNQFQLQISVYFFSQQVGRSKKDAQNTMKFKAHDAHEWVDIIRGIQAKASIEESKEQSGIESHVTPSLLSRGPISATVNSSMGASKPSNSEPSRYDAYTLGYNRHQNSKNVQQQVTGPPTPAPRQTAAATVSTLLEAPVVPRKPTHFQPHSYNPQPSMLHASCASKSRLKPVPTTFQGKQCPPPVKPRRRQSLVEVQPTQQQRAPLVRRRSRSLDQGLNSSSCPPPVQPRRCIKVDKMATSPPTPKPRIPPRPNVQSNKLTVG